MSKQKSVVDFFVGSSRPESQPKKDDIPESKSEMVHIGESESASESAEQCSESDERRPASTEIRECWTDIFRPRPSSGRINFNPTGTPASAYK